MSESADAIQRIAQFNDLEAQEWAKARDAFTHIRRSYVRLVELRTERRQFAQECAASSLIDVADASDWQRELDGGIAPNSWTTEGASALAEFGSAVRRLIDEYAKAYPDSKEDTWMEAVA